MSAAEAEAYLDRQSEWAVLSTLGHDGAPHSVPLGYFRLGDALYLGLRDHTQKVKNVERNPSAAVLVFGARSGGEVSGVLVQGEATVVRDPQERLRLAQDAARRRGVAESELPDTISRDGVYIRVQRDRTISWKYD